MRSLTGFMQAEIDALRARFWERVEKSRSQNCWEWRGYMHRGYGLVKIRGRMHNTHRIAWLLTNGEIPEGLWICWTCRNTACLNPAHLYLGTQHDKALQHDPEPAFWAKIRKVAPDACWEWSAARLESGHGHVSWRRKSRTAHAVAWELWNQACILPGYCSLHRCDNPPCCNPAHLFLGTKTDNAADREAKGRSHRGSQMPGSLLDERKIAEIRALRAAGCLQREIAERFGVSPGAIGNVLRGISWKHVTEGPAVHHQKRPWPRTHCPQGHPYDAANSYRRPKDGARICKTCEQQRHRRNGGKTEACKG